MQQVVAGNCHSPVGSFVMAGGQKGAMDTFLHIVNCGITASEKLQKYRAECTHYCASTTKVNVSRGQATIERRYCHRLGATTT